MPRWEGLVIKIVINTEEGERRRIYWLQSRQESGFQSTCIKDECLLTLENEIKPEIVYSLLTCPQISLDNCSFRFKKSLLEEETDDRSLSHVCY